MVERKRTVFSLLVSPGNSKNKLRSQRMHFPKYILALTLGVFSFSAAHSTEIELEEIPYTKIKQRIESEYTLSADVYEESIKEHLGTVKTALEEVIQNSNGRPIGLIVGENHKSEGAKCFQMFIAHLAHKMGINHLLTELSEERLVKVKKGGYQWGASAGYLQRLFKEAEEHLSMSVLPIDIDIEEKETDSLKKFEEMMLTGKERELHMIDQIKDFGQSFVFYTGANHLASLYYAEDLNKQFSLIFLSCSYPMSEETIETTDQIISEINNDDVMTIHNERQNFLQETDRFYKTPIYYNERNSMIYRMIGTPIGINPDEVRLAPIND
jgi:hypothetical protein